MESRRNGSPAGRNRNIGSRMHTYIIGIDLGTTNCTMAFAKIDEEICVEQFLIPQITAPSVVEECPQLPSFLYFPLDEELSLLKIDTPYCVGAFAKKRGEEIPDRMISSSKSWLSQDSIDRRAPLLPLNAKEPLTKLSPLEATKSILKQLKEAWDQKMDAPFNEQKVLLTVPASFDPSARELVQEAARLSHYPDLTLLEEPQAAFYAWLGAMKDAWRDSLQLGDEILVIDIGGGTTDFSMIRVTEESGSLELSRSQVGPHLLLGGDNIDYAIAYLAKDKLEAMGHTIDSWQLSCLKHAARNAKEELLNEGAKKKSVDIAIMGRGSKLIGGSLNVKIDREEVLSLILDGFCPSIPSSEKAKQDRKTGFQEVGLPFVSDPRITAQLASFLSQGESFPTAILFNGGTMKALPLQERILDTLSKWAEEKGNKKPRMLPQHDLDFAVSLGAVYYGFASQGKGIRIKSGLSRNYFIGVEEAVPAVPGRNPPIRALCIAPHGMEEGTQSFIENEQFQLAIGETASFRFFSKESKALSDGSVPVSGTWVPRPLEELLELHPIETVLKRNDNEGPFVVVSLESAYTELGVLELYCVAQDGRKWKLEYDLRQEEKLEVS